MKQYIDYRVVPTCSGKFRVQVLVKVVEKKWFRPAKTTEIWKRTDPNGFPATDENTFLPAFDSRDKAISIVHKWIDQQVQECEPDQANGTFYFGNNGEVIHK